MWTKPLTEGMLRGLSDSFLRDTITIERKAEMAEKDITEKILADYNDVFADIMNGFLFHGKQVVLPDDLETTKDKSQYKADGKIHEQERDVSKYLKKDHVTVIMTGLEHQTKAEKFMPVRQIGYDGQSYRTQLLEKNVSRVYPVITIVLYFGMQHWPYSRHLEELLDTPEIYRPFVSDYEMKNLFEVAFLEPEQVRWFKSDFRYVADYFVQMRLTNDYKPSPDTIEHVDAVLKLMSVLTGDRKFEEAIPDMLKSEGGVSMESVLDRVESKGKTEGRMEGMIHVYYNDMKLTPVQISKKLNIPVEKVIEIINKI